ncbi:hypothetical protein [Streptomyces sp. CFMR 7]|uniref:hypothetical protein n=1 Tax=Streptomyces sp. CFMR 7 TaxID=1649184 RepID=UPI0011A05688|nr:hypothetical protein [Streptomyces sp. CFMR 7]
MLNPELHARMHRIAAAQYRAAAAEQEMLAVMVTTAASLRALGRLMAEAETREVASHPDLAELNLQLDGFYGEAL